jgi:hypothetical protein
MIRHLTLQRRPSSRPQRQNRRRAWRRHPGRPRSMRMAIRSREPPLPPRPSGWSLPTHGDRPQPPQRRRRHQVVSSERRVKRRSGSCKSFLAGYLAATRLAIGFKLTWTSCRRRIRSAPRRAAASPSQMGRFETRWLAAKRNLSALADLPGQWIDRVHGRRPPRGIVLDMDSSVSPTHGEQEKGRGLPAVSAAKRPS